MAQAGLKMLHSSGELELSVSGVAKCEGLCLPVLMKLTILR